jgi:hypothetical protein
MRAGVVELRWNVRGSPGDPCRLERHDPDGDWRATETVLLDGSGQVTFVDREVVAGARYGYRLAVIDGGELTRSAEVWLQVPGGAELALRGFSPNPAGSDARVAFSVRERSPVTIDVLDVSGRRVARQVIASPEVGPSEVAIGAEAALQPGLYFIRLQQGARTLLRRGSIVR